MVAWVGPAISAASSLLGGIIGQDASDDAAKFARQQFKFQQKAAKRGITWRVKDAINAGVHPLYALGAQTFSPSPVSISGDSPMAQGIASMGQSLGQAVEAGQAKYQTQASALSQALMLEKAHLDNQLIRGQIDALKGVGGAQMPGQPNSGVDPDPPNVRRIFGMKLTRDPQRWSSAQKQQDEGGELAEWVWGTISELENIFASISPAGAKGHGINAGWKKDYYDRPPNWNRGLGGRTR